MKYLITTLLALPLMNFFVPLLARAQEDMSGVAPGTFVNSIALWIAVGIGFIASFLVFRNAHKIGGGTLGKVYYHFGFGMLLVVLGFFVVVIPAWAEDVIIMRTHDVLFIAGYLVMAFGAQKILTAAGIK